VFWVMAHVFTFGQDTDAARALRKKQGAELRKIRKEFRGLTLRALAAKIRATGVPVTAQAISQWENGLSTPRPHMKVAVARALDFPPSMVWGLDGEAA
jgi:transcriptional regulator with XRE-family HTH domain